MNLIFWKFTCSFSLCCIESFCAFHLVYWVNNQFDIVRDGFNDYEKSILVRFIGCHGFALKERSRIQSKRVSHLLLLLIWFLCFFNATTRKKHLTALEVILKDTHQEEMARRAGGGFAPACRVILFVAGGDRAGRVRKNNSYFWMVFRS